MRNKSWILCASLLVLGAGLAEAQTCPCWSAEELAAVVPALCQNDLDLNNAALESCTSINGQPEACCSFPFGFPENGWVVAWQGLACGDFQGPGCYWQHGGASRIFCQDCANSITTAEVLNCALEIAAFGETVEPTCVVDGTPCDADADCSSMCSFDGTNCQQDADCPPIGNCSVDLLVPCLEDADCPPGICRDSGGPCLTDADCPLAIEPCKDVQVCENFVGAHSCNPQTCRRVDGCFPPGCRLGWNAAKSDIVFTNQQFFLGVGLVSELITDGDFVRANCLGPFSASAADDPSDPNPGEARYFLGRTAVGVSCVDFGDSSLNPDVRDALDAVCP